MNPNNNILGFFNPTSHHYVCLNLAILLLSVWLSRSHLVRVAVHCFFILHPATHVKYLK